VLADPVQDFFDGLAQFVDPESFEQDQSVAQLSDPSDEVIELPRRRRNRFRHPNHPDTGRLDPENLRFPTSARLRRSRVVSVPGAFPPRC
jgi:hypothetical protein